MLRFLSLFLKFFAPHLIFGAWKAHSRLLLVLNCQNLLTRPWSAQLNVNASDSWFDIHVIRVLFQYSVFLLTKVLSTSWNHWCFEPRRVRTLGKFCLETYSGDLFPTVSNVFPSFRQTQRLVDQVVAQFRKNYFKFRRSETARYVSTHATFNNPVSFPDMSYNDDPL